MCYQKGWGWDVSLLQASFQVPYLWSGEVFGSFIWYKVETPHVTSLVICNSDRTLLKCQCLVLSKAWPSVGSLYLVGVTLIAWYGQRTSFLLQDHQWGGVTLKHREKGVWMSVTATQAHRHVRIFYPNSRLIIRNFGPTLSARIPENYPARAERSLQMSQRVTWSFQSCPKMMLWMVVVGFFQEKCSPVARILKWHDPVGMICGEI